MQERVAIPDFLHVRRHFLANDGGPRRYLALHVTATLDVFRSDPYRAAFTSQTDSSLSNFARMRDTQRRVGELVLDITQGKTAVVEASRAYDLSPSKVEDWVEDGKRGMENALRGLRAVGRRALLGKLFLQLGLLSRAAQGKPLSSLNLDPDRQ
jgi:hypothetical protein